LKGAVFGGGRCEKKVRVFFVFLFFWRIQGLDWLFFLHMVHFHEEVLCQNVPEVVFYAARSCQRVVFVVPNGARMDKTVF
jgi:hypothetical protein